jgi:adenylate cyclase
MSIEGLGTFRLRDLERCFLGAIPATIATCSPEGTPNITYLSIVHCLDDTHLALSFQFFNKTRSNVVSTRRAQILIGDAANLEQYRLDVCYERTETGGPVFERMRTHLAAVASQTGMTGVFRLQGADIYQVLAVEKLAHDLDLSAPEGPTDFVAALEALSRRLGEHDELEALLDATLVGLAELFDYRHAMVLLLDESAQRLYTVASHGFTPSGIGAEIAMGEGLIGTAAAEKRPVRLGNYVIDQTMATAVRTTVSPQAVGPELPLPGLDCVRSQLAVPMLSRERVLGVICVQSAEAGRLTLADEQVLATLARHLATSIQLVAQAAGGEAAAPGAQPTRSAGKPVRIRYHAVDDSVFIDDEYLIKGLPGRILLRLLQTFTREGRVDFSNRELRLDSSLQLGGYRDNLEARLILLRRRLEERSSVLRLTRTGRGRFRLELERPFELIKAR